MTLLNHEGRPYHRHFEEIIRVALQALEYYGERGMVITRLMYAIRSTTSRMPDFIEYLEDRELIKFRQVVEADDTPHAEFKICITRKGARVLELMQEQKKMIPKAPWLDENIPYEVHRLRLDKKTDLEKRLDKK